MLNMYIANSCGHQRNIALYLSNAITIGDELFAIRINMQNCCGGYDFAFQVCNKMQIKSVQ